MDNLWYVMGKRSGIYGYVVRTEEMSQVESAWILQLQLESQAGVPSRDPSASPERSGAEDMRQKFNQRSSRSTLVLNQIPVVGTGRPGKRGKMQAILVGSKKADFPPRTRSWL